MRKDLENWLARAGQQRDAAPIAALMRGLFATEIIEQQRLVSVLMARSDCTPPAPTSNRIPSSTSALIVSSPSAATAADFTRIHDQMEALGKRHRRAFRGMLALLALFVFAACLVAYFLVGKFQVSGSRATAALDNPPAATIEAPHAPPAPVQLPGAEPLELQPAAPPTSANAGPAPKSARPTAPSLKATSHALPLAAPAVAGAKPEVVASAKPEVAANFGFLTLDTHPWSVVSVGGRVLGQTPLVNVKLPAGAQVLSLRNSEQGIEASYPVQIEAGKTTVRRIGIE
jgi:hypothetical protein